MKRLPRWLRRRHSLSELRSMKGLLRGHGLSTVCEEARCPNKAECFSKPTATFMILGDRCTRNCGFCSVESMAPSPPEADEPLRVAQAARAMGLRYVVVTSVTRDDLQDGGAGHFARTIGEIRRCLPGAKVEVLTPDFKGSAEALGIVLEAGPDVFNHNLETVPRLYSTVRPQADYNRSVELLRKVKEMSPGVRTKSGLMLGLGEGAGEVLETLRDLRGAGCDSLTLGQYLRPGKGNLPVAEYVEPEVFESLRGEALAMGFGFVASGPLVRSSMNAEELYEGNV
ncbi:MAG: lipoyl synthase [Nitrospirota bacterium]